MEHVTVLALFIVFSMSAAGKMYMQETWRSIREVVVLEKCGEFNWTARVCFQYFVVANLSFFEFLR